jgi:hypothetical protein
LEQEGQKKTQIPCGDDNQRGKNKSKKQVLPLRGRMTSFKKTTTKARSKAAATAQADADPRGDDN